MHPFLGRLIVNFVLCLISFISYSSQIFIIWPWYGRVISVELVTLLLPFNTFVAMLLWNYFLCIVTDPGQVPPHWKPDTLSDGFEVKKISGQPRYCRMCEGYKPPRAHHCRQCNRCVLRMDHHCPWINNCVGHFNYGHFIRFLFYVDVACSYHLAMITRRVTDTWGARYWDEPTGVELIFIILNYVACVPVLLSVGAFSIYHFLCLLSNTTTIESWEKDKAAMMLRRGKIREIRFPYNIGKRRNIESVLGKNPFLWCWPTITPGDGLRYQLTYGDESNADLTWPPRDPETVQNSGPRFDPQSSPWTYGSESINPNLRPSNARLRALTKRGKCQASSAAVSALPPYHPDYGQSLEEDQEYLSSESRTSHSDSDGRHPLVRRGSEGYEVKSVDREEMLRRYLKELGEEPGRYHRYTPEPDSETDKSSDIVPLASVITQDQQGIR